MRRAEASRLLLMESLVSCGSHGATRDDLMHLSGLSQGAFYKTIKPLIEERAVAESGDRYRLPMSSLQNYRFKLWRDAEAIKELPLKAQGLIEDVLAQTKDAYKDNLEALWLIGSAAHGEFNPVSSDLDFLAIVRRSIPTFHPRVAHPIQFATLVPRDFEAKLQASDSFCLSALRYGVLLEDKGLARNWLDLPNLPDLQIKPLKEIKATLDHLRGRYLFFLKNDAEEDIRAAVKAYAVTLGRAMLAAFQELPRGKPDLLDKLKFYYGEEILPYFVPAIGIMAESLDELENIWRCFRANYLELTQLKGLLYASSIEFNIQCAQIIQKLGELAHYPGDTDFDWAFARKDGMRLYMECRSTYSALDDEELDKFCLKLREPMTFERPLPNDFGIFIFNPFNKKEPLWREWELDPKHRDLAQKHRVTCVSSKELLSFYNFWKVTGDFPNNSELATLFT